MGEVAISFDGEKAWSSLYHSILSGGNGSLNLNMQQIRPLHSNRVVAVRLHPVLSRRMCASETQFQGQAALPDSLSRLPGDGTQTEIGYGEEINIFSD